MHSSPRAELARLVAADAAAVPSSGRIDLVPAALRVHVDGVGDLAAPVTASQARTLRALGQPAPYGRGEETLTDPAVRHTWQIPRDLVSVDWGGQLEEVLEAARGVLGLPIGCRLSAELHSMLVYERGQFFVAHQDSEKHDAMVASLVVILPSAHTGGELVVHDGDRAVSYPGSRTEPTLVAFYADRLHEVKPVRSGHRITLTYNLLLHDAVDVSPDGDVAAAAALLERHFSTRPRPRWTGDDRPPPIRLAYLLDHQYTARGLSWRRLKGVDIDRAAMLRAAARRAGCEARLALADIHEIWDASGSDWYDEAWDEEDDSRQAVAADDAELNSLIDSDWVLTHWLDPADGRVQPAGLGLGDSEVCATTATIGLEPYDSRYEGYMGNYGNTVDRWYRRAAVAVWPARLAFANRTEASLAWGLEDLLARLRDGRTEDALADLETLTSLCRHAVRSSQEADRLLGLVLALAELIDDRGRAGRLLDPFDVASLRADHMPALVAAAHRYGADWAGERIRSWFGEGSRVGHPGARDGWLTTLPELCERLRNEPALAERLLATAWLGLESEFASLVAADQTSRTTQRLEALAAPVAAVLRATAVAGTAPLRDKVIDACRRERALACLLQLLREAEAWPDDMRRDARVGDLATYAVGLLRERLARPARDPDDWSIASSGGCDCELCRPLADFLADSSQQRLEWPLAQAKRQHVHSRIDAAELPVTHRTRRTGRPFTLVLTKTPEVFARERRDRDAAREALNHIEARWT